MKFNLLIHDFAVEMMKTMPTFKVYFFFEQIIPLQTLRYWRKLNYIIENNNQNAKPKRIVGIFCYLKLLLLTWAPPNCLIF